MTPLFSILFVGDAHRQEFCAAANWLQARGARLTPDISAALDVLREPDFSPALIVLAQLSSHPFAPGQIDTLRRTAPLARIVRLLDPWLEGEGRTGQPVPAALRFKWHQWPGRLQYPTELAMSDSQSNLSLFPSPWSLPVTADENDCLLAAPIENNIPELLSNRLDHPSQKPSPVPLIAVCAQNRETAQSLCDICTQCGWKSLWLRMLPAETPLSVDAVVFDLAFGMSMQTEMLSAMKAIVGATPIIALLGFPRPDDLSRLQSAGAAAVVSKPFLADDLLWQIEQLLPIKTVG